MVVKLYQSLITYYQTVSFHTYSWLSFFLLLTKQYFYKTVIAFSNIHARKKIKIHINVDPSVTTIVSFYNLFLAVGLILGHIFIALLGVYLSILIANFMIIWAIMFGLFYFSVASISISILMLTRGSKILEMKT